MQAIDKQEAYEHGKKRRPKQEEVHEIYGEQEKAEPIAQTEAEVIAMRLSLQRSLGPQLYNSMKRPFRLNGKKESAAPRREGEGKQGETIGERSRGRSHAIPLNVP